MSYSDFKNLDDLASQFNNITSGYLQCIAEMIAAKLFNERHKQSVPYLLGVVTTGSNWRFLKLAGNQVLIDFDEYLISQLEKILGIFVDTLRQLAPSAS